MPMLQQLGESIARHSAQVTGGVLVFFPSYRLLNDACKLWTSKGIIEQMKATKSFYKES